MAILDDFLARTKGRVYTAENKPLFLFKGFVLFIVATHVLMLPRLVAETDWDVLHSLLLFFWLTAGVLATILSQGAFFVIFGLWVLLSDYIEKLLLLYVLSDWFQEGMGAACASIWTMCLVGAPVMVALTLFAWNTWSEEEQETLANK